MNKLEGRTFPGDEHVGAHTMFVIREGGIRVTFAGAPRSTLSYAMKRAYEHAKQNNEPIPPFCLPS